MKKLLIWLAGIVLILGALWYWAETWLSNRTREAIAANDQLRIASIVPLRNPTRIGLHMEALDTGDDKNGLSAQDLDIYVPVYQPNALTINLPRHMTIHQSGALHELNMDKGILRASFSPSPALTLHRVRLEMRNFGIDGVTPLFESADAKAKLIHMGVAAPDGSAAAYAIDLNMNRLAAGTLKDRINIVGLAQIWLSSIPGKAVLDGQVPPPHLTGIQTSGIDFRMGGMHARLISRITADENGFAEGEAALYTDDARAFIDAAIEAGLIPQRAAMMVGALLKNLSDTRIASDNGQTDNDRGASRTHSDKAGTAKTETNSVDDVVSLPPAGPGQVRLPIILKDGKIRLGPIPLGPAPRLVPAQATG
ncbi:MAG: DUF2125 domain-containing protein [Paracoccus sp. (in: a-proteobacteria)]